MASVPRYGETASTQKRSQGTRRTWNAREEQELINCLKEMLTSGWRADNSFKPGYLQAIEGVLNVRLPTAKITVKHINSKLTVWKKTYYQLIGMQGTSGFGWNDSGHLIEVDDDVWQLYVKAHPDVASMRYKSYIYFDDWVDIFGKDRATGDAAEDFQDVVEDLLKTNPIPNHIPTETTDFISNSGIDEMLYNSPCVDLTTDFSDGSDVHMDLPPYKMGLPSIHPKKLKLTKKIKKEPTEKKEKQERKRKATDSTPPDSLKADVDTFVVAAKSTWKDLSSTFAKEEDTYDDKAIKIIKALENISSLTEENRIYLEYKIMDNAKHISLFLNSSEKSREIQAHMMLEGKMP